MPPLLQARLLLLRRDLAAADRLLAELDDGPSGDPAITALRARTLLWALGDPGAARALHTRSTGIDLLAQALQGQVAPVAEQAGVARRSPAQLDGHGRFALATSQLELGQVTGVPELVAGTGAADDDLHAALTGTAGRAHLLQGEVAKAEQVAEALAGQRRGAAVVLAEASLLRGLVELHRGRPGRGAVHLRTALALSDDGDWPLRRVRALALLAVSLAWSGSAARAGEVLAEAASTAAAWPGLALAAAAVELARAETLLATGALRSAHDLASEWAAVAEDAGRLTDAVLALHLASRAQPTPHVAHGLRRLAERCEFALARLHADYATALAERDGRGLLAVADRYREAGAVPVSAEAVLQAAAVFHERGRSTMAATATVQGEALVDALEFPAPPWWPAPGGAVLTPREWEIAALAAQGMGSRTIADRLHLSTRTVDNHLQHCFRKLGISSRSELGGVLHARRSPGWSGRSPTPP